MKLQLFYQYKFDSDRLKEKKYKINITLEDARRNNEVISIGNSQLIRSIFRVSGTEYSQDYVDRLNLERRRIKRSKDCEENRKRLLRISEELDEILFIEELISVKFSNKAHYYDIYTLGLYVNDARYVPFMASAGQVRRNTATFVKEDIRERLMEILENGRDKSVPIVPGKWNSYFALYSSTSFPVSFPRFALVKDCEIKAEKTVDFIEYLEDGTDDSVSERTMEITTNPFDGCGLMKPSLAEKWSKELGLDYCLSTVCIRAPFLKGMLVTFDIDAFSRLVARSKIITDIYGNRVNVENIDCIISESMLKLWNAYPSAEEYISNCTKNGFDFGIAKYNPKTEKTHCRSSYQFLQILNLSDENLAKLCAPTVDWVSSLSGFDAEKMIIYGLGENRFSENWFDAVDPVVKAIIINRDLSVDPFISDHFINTINKKISESYKGQIILNGHYDAMISEPYAQCCHAFGLPVRSLLKDGEHYNKYWLDRGIMRLASVRSPIVHNSELNILNLVDTGETRFWYKHIMSGTVYPPYGIGMDDAIHGGADHDYDIVATINSPEMIEGKIPSKPILYTSRKAEKHIIDGTSQKILIDAQIRGFNSKVGYCTNVSSSYYCLREEFPEDSDEHRIISNRLKILRAIQGEIIDSVKGIDVPPFREHWVKKMENPEHPIYERVLLTKRPLYFIWLYPDYMRRYRKEKEIFDTQSIMRFGYDYDALKNKADKTSDEIAFLDYCKRMSFFIDNSSVMNRISRHMIKSVKNISNNKTQFNWRNAFRAFADISDDECEFFDEIYAKHKSYKRLTREENHWAVGIKREIEKRFSSSNDVAEKAIVYVYTKNRNKSFLWDLFSDEIVNFLIDRFGSKVLIPLPDDAGKIEYLFRNYSLQEIDLLADTPNGIDI